MTSAPHKSDAGGLSALTPVIPDTSGPLADFLVRMTAIESSGLVACHSGRHVVPIVGGAWRARLPDEAAG